ncbi:MAG: hypothetical protein KAI47_20820, partial [Deltaproteobacteria bacterium]|nr:hypothetical protein [Deltaproteobacteria bacterium]
KNIEAQEHEKSRVERAKRILPPLAQHREARRERDALGNVRMLSEDAASQRQDALLRRRDASSRHQGAMEKRRHLEEKMSLADTQINDKLLATEGSINTIYREFGAVEKTLADLPRRQGELAEKRAAAEKTLHALGLDIALEEAETLRPFLTRQRLIDELAQGRALLDQDQARIEKGLRQIRREGEAIARDLADAPSTTEASTELGAVVDAARRAGDLPTRWVQSHKKLQDEQDQLRQDLSRLGRFGGGIEALAEKALPHEETLDPFEDLFDESTAQTRDHQSTERRLRRERAQVQERLQALRAISDIPRISDLQDARDHRDSLWGEIRQHFIEDAAPSSERPPSADTYEERVEGADGLADRLRQHADAAAQEATLSAQLERLDEERVHLDNERQVAERKEAERQALWDAIWTPLGVDAASPKEMKAWTQRAEHLITRYRALMTTEAETRVLGRKIHRHVETLAAQVGNATPIADDDPERLTAIFETHLERATSILEAQTQAAEKRRALQTRASENSLRQDETKRDLADLQSQRKRWKERWHGARADLPLGDTPDPTHALEVLRQLAIFFESFDDAVKLERRIETMEA